LLGVLQTIFPSISADTTQKCLEVSMRRLSELETKYIGLHVTCHSGRDKSLIEKEDYHSL
ncbi:hypothetical protein PFISCL1PPCAC_25581, partial [Pristionchus fissidentatus]